MFLSKRHIGNKSGVKGVFLRFTVFICIALASFIYWAGCRNDPDAPKPRVEELAFENPKVDMKIGERQAVKINIKPTEARKHHKVEYSASVEGYVAISETSNDGCVLTAEKGGTVVVVAKADGYTAYLEVAVENEEYVQVPYIMVPTQVIEVSEGSRKSVQVSLFNGSAIDQQQFTWAVELGKDNISINPTGNTVVVQGEKRGSQKVIVSHDKSEYTAEILVFVLGVDEKVKYITTGQNVLLMNAGGENKQFSATLVNGAATDISGFSFNIAEEEPCITILSNNNTCNVIANRKGTAVIHIEHPLAEYPLDVRIIVLEGEESYIELDKTFTMLDIGQGCFINASIGGTHKESWNNEFEYSLKGDADCININQTNFSFYITAVKSGRCIIEVKNKNITYSREALIVVRDETMVPPDEYYITTSQNVLQLEIGQTYATQLNIQLINGNEGDKASFEWTVEDGRVVEVEALDLPLGKEVNYLARAQAEVKMVANTLALVTPKKVGTTKITITHPKSESVATVICKVYPRGTFANQTYILENVEGGLIRVDTTEADKKVQLKMLSGDAASVGSLQWTIANGDLASVQDMHELENYIKGKNSGVTKLTVNNQNLKYPYEATVMVGTTEELKNMSVLYVDQVYQTVAVGQSISVTVKNSGGENNALANDNNYIVSGYDKTKIVATMIKNRLLLQGLAETSAITEVTISNTSNPLVTPTQVKVTVVPAEITMSTPYSLTGPDFVGMNYGQEKMVTVGLTDATDVEKGKIQWKSDNAAVVKVTGNGENGILTAGNSTTQTNITVSHSKSVNDKVMVAYVVPSGVDPESAVVLGIAQDHWLLKPEEEVMLQLLTNADETATRNVNDIAWGSDNDAVVSVDYNGSRALVKAHNKSGSAVITVTHPKKVIDLKIYISVSDMVAADKTITLPSIVELIIGENKVITAVTQGLSPEEIKGITWAIDDSGVAGISGEGTGLTGGKLFIQGKGRGQAWITVKQDSFGYQKKILVVCARTYEELMNTFVLASEDSYYRMRVGDSRDIRLISGSAGFPDGEKPFITWKDEGNKVIKIYADGDHAKIEAVAQGITTVTVNHSLLLKPVSITFEAYNESLTGTDYIFNSNTLMVGLVVRKGYNPATESAAEFADVNNTKNLMVAINPPGPSYAGITARDEEPGKKVFAYKQSSNEFILTGMTAGQTYLRIEHPQVNEPLRILVYAANTKEELDNMFPIGLSKTNYLLTLGGDSEYIRITTPPEGTPGYADKIKKISWALDNTSIVSRVYSADNKEAKIDGLKAGNCVFDIKYDGQVVEKAYVSVKSKTAMDMSKRIVTENIIGLKLGDSGSINRKTSIGSNLTPDEIATLEWRTNNPSVVSISPVSGEKGSQYLTAAANGETEVVVSFGQMERHIKVYVNDNPGQYKAVNIDNRYYQIRRNNEMVLTAFHAALPCTSSDNWVFYPKTDPFDTRVVELTNEGKDKVRIRGLNEGIATVVLYNTECATDVSFMVEVNNTAPLVEDFIEDWYMTAFKTVYALDPAKTMDWMRVTISGVRFPPEQLTQIKWRVKSEEVDGVKRELKETDTSTLIDLVNKSGTFVDIAPKNKKGTAVLTASHERSVNKELDITVICSAELVAANPVAHIVTDKEVVKIKKGETSEINVSIEDFTGLYDISKFTAVSDTVSKVTVHITGNKLTVKGVDWGQALVTIAHPDVTAMQKKIVVMVNAGNDLVYLSTRQNFVVLEKNNYQAVEVELIGMTDYNNNNYLWDTDDWDIISINASGKQTVVTAKNVTKTAKITVRHLACPEYPLYIYVRVTDKISSNPVYITTSNNIVSLKEGVSMQIKANLVNGGGHELSQFTWSTGDRNLIELNFSGDTAMVKGLKSGTAGVSIWHPSSLNAITIIVVVEPNEPNNGIYITTDTLLVEVATTASQQQIKARLVGGSPEDIYGFQWSVTRYNSVMRKGDGTAFQVIDMNANADICYIYPRKEGGVAIEGEAIVTISHPKTNYKLDVKVVVSDQTNISLGQTYLTMNQYTQQTVSVTASASSKLSYTSTNNNVATVEGNDKVCVIDAKAEGTVIIIVSNMSGTKSSELIVRVNPVDKNDYFYLKLDASIITMQTSGSARVVSAEVIDSKTGQVNSELTNGVKWKIKESDRNKGVVKLDGYNDATVVRTGSTVGLYPAASGEIEVICGFFDANDPLLKRYPTLAENCAGKSIYVKVQVDAYQFVLSHAVIRMNEAETVDDVWARVDGVSPEPNYLENGDILWASEKPEVVAVVYQNNTNQRSNVSLVAMKPGNAQIYANYGTNRQVISVVVAANAYVSSTKSNISLMPDIADTFIITSNPQDKNITVTVDSNAACTFEYRPYFGEEKINGSINPHLRPWANNAASFTTQSTEQANLGYSGYEVRVTGSLYESVATMTFEMRDTGKRTQVTINNFKNYYVKWTKKAQARFKPNDDLTSNFDNIRIYYEISPPDDELVWEGNNGPSNLPTNYRVITGSDTQGKYIQFEKPEGKAYFGTCGISAQYFYAKKTNDRIPLGVYIYYDTVDVGWQFGTRNYIDNISGPEFKNANLGSTFDAVNYSVTIWNYEKITLKMVPSSLYPGHGISNLCIEITGGDAVGVQGNVQDQQGDEIWIYYSTNDFPPSNAQNNVIKNISYKALGTITYKRYNGGESLTEFKKNILIYGADVSRKN